MKICTVDLEKSYAGKKVVNRVNLEINSGEIVGLLGPNGAGKTTIFNIVIGLLKPDNGKVYLDDVEITTLPMHIRARKGLGYLSQEPSIFRRLTVEQNMDIVLEYLNLSKEEKQKRKEMSLKTFGLINMNNKPAYLLSGGEKRRCEIARAMLTEPKFFLLDEPFVGIDPIAVAEIQKLVFDLKTKGIGILITDHNVRETLAVIDRAYIIYEGRILIEGDAKELISSEEARKIYLGEKFHL